MCGIVGILNCKGEPVPAPLLKRMTDSIAHRGPDGEGQYIDGCVGLGHRRLAILDLSTAGHQPMANENGKVIVSYNGEIYNFQKLRIELESLGHRFHSQTDTEVVVHAYEEWGDDCVLQFNGMFAFALWDSARKRLVLARDRYGIKPLYWYFANGVFICASEIKAILEHPVVSRQVCIEALGEYFTFQNIFSDRTLFEGIHILPAGCMLILSCAENSIPAIHRYWDFSGPGSIAPTNAEATERLQHLISQAVTRQLVSDVPVGSYLSGGMDSGSITAIASRHLRRLTTFTGGFDLTSASGLELGFDERAEAEALANLFKTEHYEVVLHAGDMEWVMPELVWHLEDLRVGQCYPNYYVARLAGKFVKVVLSGAGGDELFGGYPWRYFRGIDGAGRDQYFRNYYQFWQRLVPDEDKNKLFNDDTSRSLRDHSPFDVFRDVFQGWRGSLKSNGDFLEASLYFELKTFLHGLLVVEDKLSMAHGLETRVPFLDDDLVEYASQLPACMKVNQPGPAGSMDENEIGKRRLYESRTNDGKVVLRKAMQRFIPLQVTKRTKQGFSAPDASWFRGESIDYINKLLRNPRSRIYEFLNPAFVTDALDEHCSARTNRRLLIWSFLSFEWWLRRFMN